MCVCVRARVVVCAIVNGIVYALSVFMCMPCVLFPACVFVSVVLWLWYC